MIRKKIGHGSVVLESFTYGRDENYKDRVWQRLLEWQRVVFLTGINEELKKKKTSIVTNTRQLPLAARISLIK